MDRQEFKDIASAWNPLFLTFMLRILQAASPQYLRVGHLPMYEGGRLTVGYDSDMATADFQRAGGIIDIPVEAMRNTDFPGFVNSIATGALELNDNRHKTHFSQLDEILEKTGRSFDNEGQPLTWERLIGFLDKLDFSFDENGEWLPPTIFTASERMAATVQRIYDERLSDPAKHQQFEDLVRRKWEAHCDREAHRELVD